MKILFDFDGTLIDSKPRLYKLFQDIVPDSSLSFDDYWVLKRNKIDHEQILTKYFNYNASQIKHFKKKWLKKIEQKKYLKLDEPFQGVGEFLATLKMKNIDLYLITARQNENYVFGQLSKFGLNEIFTDVFVTKQNTEKYELLARKLALVHNDWIIGDTGKDIETGKKLGIRTAAVLTGFRNEQILRSYKPDCIIDNIIDFNLGEENEK